jgi:hypothetical protein
MNKAIIAMASVFIALIPAAATAAGEKWVEASSSAGGKLYFDAVSLKNDVQFVSLLVLNDFKEPAHDGKLTFKSMISRQMINCATNMVFTNYVAYRAGNMGEGDLVYSSDAIRESQRAAPGTMLGNLVERHCN